MMPNRNRIAGNKVKQERPASQEPWPQNARLFPCYYSAACVTGVSDFSVEV